ncbi:hypothetical protein [Limnoglobus roseus]|uniref:Uncharacterized protein n=1 Tax=Limnoglobus roseus TaxID=2598579 RepID=A0A5C1AUQ7_9BACT|nr:hypothetical protein [Limnoglobus roseus]QEL20994.1 hypothetical protein PX52LOC_08122 [Limnoglobus roseus]
MTRMTRDFSLVLLGAGILSAGYFLAPSPDLEAKADEQAAERVGGGERDSSGRYHYRPGYAMIWVHSGGYSGGAGRAPAVGGVSRGGFGGIGRSAGVGG